MRDLVIRWFLLLFAFGCQQSAIVEVGVSVSCMEEACWVVFLGGLPEVTRDGEVLFGIGFFMAEGRVSSCGACCMRLLRVASRRLQSFPWLILGL